MNFELLNSVNSPEELKAVDKKDIPALISEIREFLIEKVEKSGGHLASNLGAVELTVAMHRIFDSPRDHIIFDVGHQAYVHKMLTGRRESFDDLRVPGGLSGFTTRRESEHDCFGAGHSSTAISAALGFAEADALTGSENYTVCVVGDGAFTGGMVHEALNNCKKDLKLIIILNENRMSISKNKGAFASYLAKVRISKGYRSWKRGTNSFLRKIPLIGKPILAALSFVKRKLKKIVYSNNYFEELGLYYLGPVDGNDYEQMERALTEAKNSGQCTVIHAYTQKGKGYAPAEESPDSFHSVSGGKGVSTSFHAIAAEELIKIAESDDRCVAITAAMGIGTGLDNFGQRFPDRYFDVGIAEEHALTFSAGLAAAGLKPYVAVYSTFLQRSYDNILHDVALQNLPVRMMIDRAGLAPSDGPTHHGIFDVAFLSHIPGLTIFSPATYKSLTAAMEYSASVNTPVAIRYPNAHECDGVDKRFGDFNADLYVRADFEVDETPDFVFVTYGHIVGRVIEAADRLSLSGVSAGIILTEKIKPLSGVVDFIEKHSSKAKKILFVEEGVKNGGFSMIALDTLGAVFKEKSEIAAIDDSFAAPEVKCNIYDYVGLSAGSLYKKALSMLDLTESVDSIERGVL